MGSYVIGNALDISPAALDGKVNARPPGITSGVEANGYDFVVVVNVSTYSRLADGFEVAVEYPHDIHQHRFAAPAVGAPIPYHEAGINKPAPHGSGAGDGEEQSGLRSGIAQPGSAVGRKRWHLRPAVVRLDTVVAVVASLHHPYLRTSSS